MTNEMIYEYQKSTGLKAMLSMSSDKIWKMYVSLGAGVFGLLVAIVAFGFYHRLLLLLLLLPFLLLIITAAVLKNCYLKAVLKKNQIEKAKLTLSIEEFNRRKLGELLDRKGYQSQEAVNAIKAQIKLLMGDKRKLEIFNVISFSTVITVIILIITVIVKDAKPNEPDFSHIITEIFICVSISYLLIYLLATDFFDWFWNFRYRRLEEIYLLLGDIALEKITATDRIAVDLSRRLRV